MICQDNFRTNFRKRWKILITTVIFDLDGTLLDTLDDIRDSVNRTLTQFGFPSRTREEIRRFVGNGAVKLLERALPHPVDAQTFQAFYTAYDRDYTAHRCDKTAPYAGVLPMLQMLRDRGIRTAVLSNKQDNVVRPLCESFFPQLLDLATGPADGRAVKPAPDGILYIADTLHVPLSDILYVGDSETDVQTGRNAGVRTIAVLWGFRDRDTLTQAGAVRFAETPEEILRFI